MNLLGQPAPPSISIASEPNLIDVTWTVPAQPAAFAETLSIGSLFPAAFGVPAPALNFGTAPTQFSGAIPASPSIDLNFDFPTISLDLPTPPSLLTLDAIAFDAPTIPDFNPTVPVLSIVAPNVVPFKEGAQFTSGLLTQVQTDLQNALSEGTWTGLPGDIEVNLFDRAREREYRQQADALASLDRDMEVLGYAFPPGVWLDARIKIQTETAYTISGLSRDIMIKQAELTLDNITKARAIAVDLEGKLIDYSNQVQQRAFETSKYITEASIALYNAGVQAYAAQLEGYKTQAAIYDSRIRGLLAQVEVLKAHIEFEQAKASINTAIVEQYKSEVDASEVVVEIYKAQLSAIETQANIQKIKVDVYGAQIQAFGATVNAYTAEVEGYKASVQTQGVIEDVYKTQVEAFATQVDAASKQADVLIEKYKGDIQAYTAQLEGYKAAIESMVGQAEAASKYNIAQAEVFKAEAEALGSYNGTLTAQWQALLNEQIQAANVGVATAKANGDLYIAARGLSLDASKVGAQVTAQLGASALGAVHWSNSVGWSMSSSVSAANSATNIGEFVTSQSESA